MRSIRLSLIKLLGKVVESGKVICRQTVGVEVPDFKFI